MTGATWNSCHLGWCCVHHTTMHHVASCKDIRMVHVTCHLHFFTRYCGNTGGGTDTEIRVSTESWPWRRKFARRSCRDSIPRLFNHESGALTTELFPLPVLWRSAQILTDDACKARGSRVLQNSCFWSAQRLFLEGTAQILRQWKGSMERDLHETIIRDLCNTLNSKRRKR